MKEITGPLHLHNPTCIYCGRAFDSDAPRTREHVIGRNFVPEGSFKANDWNLFVWACRTCNNEKAKLEGEISAITLQPNIGSTHPHETLNLLAERKAAKARSEATGRVVKDSRETFEHTYFINPSASITFSFVAPPRLVPERVKALAWAQLHAFFYFLTYSEHHQQGSGLPGGIAWYSFTHKPDWGNPHFLAFASLTKAWHGRIRAVAAEGYFRLAIKRDPSAIELWSFALEWNQNLRIVGFFGDAKAALAISASLPPFEWRYLDEATRMREETPLTSSEDEMFATQFQD
jgi:hypothetical protein